MISRCSAQSGIWRLAAQPDPKMVWVTANGSAGVRFKRMCIARASALKFRRVEFMTLHSGQAPPNAGQTCLASSGAIGTLAKPFVVALRLRVCCPRTGWAHCWQLLTFKGKGAAPVVSHVFTLPNPHGLQPTARAATTAGCVRCRPLPQPLQCLTATHLCAHALSSWCRVR